MEPRPSLCRKPNSLPQHDALGDRCDRLADKYDKFEHEPWRDRVMELAEFAVLDSVVHHELDSRDVSFWYAPTRAMPDEAQVKQHQRELSFSRARENYVEPARAHNAQARSAASSIGSVHRRGVSDALDVC